MYIFRSKKRRGRMLRILVADDHALFREGLKQILHENFDGVESDEASNGYEVMDKIALHDYDVLLLDIAMPGLSGLDVLKQLKGKRPKMRVLVLSMYPEGQYAVRAIRAGASGYLTKRSASDELIEAIKKVSQGGIYVTSAIAEKLMFDLKPDSSKPPHECLSDREFQIFCMIASGKTVGTIAEELNLSVKTVSTHRVHILEKMNMKNNAELTNYAIKFQVINLTD
jgi:DNA-binding NarL/FixJ family response regulator